VEIDVPGLPLCRADLGAVGIVDHVHLDMVAAGRRRAGVLSCG
jgi:hypothetical protein